jgi:phage recombination protein Bet
MSNASVKAALKGEVVQRPRLVAKFAEKYSVDPDKLLVTLKATVFKGDKEITNEQLMALLIVADQYSLNPFTREIFAFPSKGGIVPFVPIDGWVKIMQSHPQFDGLSFTFADAADDEIPAWIECTIHHKGRSHPTVVREYFSECVRNTDPWKTHPRRMLRHKALIQAARIAFGFGGIFDPDEAERIRDAVDATPPRKPPLHLPERQPETVEQPPEPPAAAAPEKPSE